MPEGPEIRLAADRIAKVLVGREIVDAALTQSRLRKFGKRLVGATVTAVDTRGKAMLTRFDNGLTLFVIPDRYTRLVQFDVRHQVGSREDPPGKEGMAHFVEHLMFQMPADGPGTPKLMSDIQRHALGFNAYTAPDETHYMHTGTAANLERYFKYTALRLSYDCDAVIWAAPTFVASYVIEGAAPVPWTYSPWLTANLTLNRQPIGAGPDSAWENVIFESPSLGYVVWDRRRKLKPEYHDLPGEKIRDLRLSGTEVTEEFRRPLVAYAGDTAPAGLDDCPEMYEAKVLICELTFVSPQHRKEKIHKFGHMHLDDFVERQDRFKNELVIAAHLSTRYHPNTVKRMVQTALPDMLDGRLMLWL